MDDRHRKRVVSRQATGFREVGDGLMVVDWLMERAVTRPGARRLSPGRDGVRPLHLVRERNRPGATRIRPHGPRHQPSQRVVEGPQLCHRMKPVQPDGDPGRDFVR